MSSPWKQKVPTPQSGDGDRELVPEGNHPAVCVALVDFGTHTKEYQGKETTARKVFIVWELVDEPSKPCIGKDFTLSLHEKALLRGFLKKWRGKDIPESEEFDVSAILGKPCNLTVTHKPSKDGLRTFAQIEAATALVKGQKVGNPSREPFLWSVADGDITDLPDWLPWLYGKSIPTHVEASAEYAGAGSGDAAEGKEADAETAPAGGPIPF
jgi:hypothetical protein